MRILITGGFGYLGGRIAQALAAEHTIVLGSRQSREVPDWLPSAEVARTDWASRASLADACRGADAIIHAAGDHTDALISEAGAARFLYLSTAHVYGAPLEGVITEETPTRGTTPYAASRLAGEKAVMAKTDARESDGMVLRISNGFGAPASAACDCWGLLTNDICRQAIRDREVRLRSDGMQRRDFIPIAELTRAVSHLLAHRPGPGSPRVFNVGGQWSPTVLEFTRWFAERIERTLGFAVPTHAPAPEPGRMPADLTYRIDALRGTGFQPAADAESEADSLIGFCARTFR